MKQKDFSELSVIILAGGRSRRMGKDKRKIILDDKSLFEYSLLLAKSFSDDIIISANDNLDLFNPFVVVTDKYKDAGPVAGIISALAVIKNRYALLLTCDMPFITDDLINSLIKEKSPDELVMFDHPDNFYPFPALIPVELETELNKKLLEGTRSVKRVLEDIPLKRINIPPFTPQKAFMNINRPDEYRSAIEKM